MIGTRQIIALLCAFAVSPTLAQAYKTEIPTAIMTPDTIETRLGTLKFIDGFPDT